MKIHEFSSKSVAEIKLITGKSEEEIDKIIDEGGFHFVGLRNVGHGSDFKHISVYSGEILLDI